MKNALNTRALVCFVWLLLVAAGFGVIIRHQTTVGTTGAVPKEWPVSTDIPRATNCPSLIMFAHPRCPCTRASLEELNRILAHLRNRVAVHVVFFQPSSAGTDWLHSGSWKTAASLPGVCVAADVDGKNARLFGAQTSGHVLLYDRNGKLIFDGGITGSRGHSGANPGASAVCTLLAGEPFSTSNTKVYGCSLLTPCDNSEKP